LSGAAGDRFGRRRTFQVGLTVFPVGSLLCSLAPNIDTLIAARLVQAIGGSMMNAGRDVDHHAGVHRSGGTGARDRRLGRRRRRLHGASARSWVAR